MKKNTKEKNTEPMNPKTASATLNIIRDKYCRELSAQEQTALIIAENMIRENPELAAKYIR